MIKREPVLLMNRLSFYDLLPRGTDLAPWVRLEDVFLAGVEER